MDMEERTYSVLVVSSSDKFNTALSSLLTKSRYTPVKFVNSVSASNRALLEQPYDFVIVNSPLTDDTGIRLAITTAQSKETVSLLLVRSDFYDEIFEKVSKHGVFTLHKPLSNSTFSLALEWMESARERLRALEKKSLSFEEKMEEIRIVNRAKWLLISELKMDEPAAHRHIEKQAMDRCLPKREIAEEIIKKYA
ncbi:MAG: ANTAR domain-containing protein [Lachnospiraceae bacterium]|nr:ANTAR domain-containing protein [Lachnospiraceae bacterium]